MFFLRFEVRRPGVGETLDHSELLKSNSQIIAYLKNQAKNSKSRQMWSLCPTFYIYTYTIIFLFDC